MNQNKNKKQMCTFISWEQVMNNSDDPKQQNSYTGIITVAVIMMLIFSSFASGIRHVLEKMSLFNRLIS